MFEDASSFNQDISGWDVLKGTNFVSDVHMYSLIDKQHMFLSHLLFIFVIFGYD